MKCYFEFNQLPLEVQKDVLKQYENVDTEDEFDINNMIFEKVQLKYKEILEILDEVFGPNLEDYIYADYVVQLAKDISTNGLRYPPVGKEGYHRLLAFAYLERDIPYFKIIDRKEKQND